MTTDPKPQPGDTAPVDPVSVTSAMTALFESTAAQRGGADLEPGSVATPFSTFYWAAIRYLQDGAQADRDTAEAQFADDIEWDMMNNGQVRKGKAEVLTWCWSGGFASHKQPVIIHNSASGEWGVWEYWNIGTLTADVVAFAKASKWPFPPHADRLVGRTYMIPVCFVYHINPQNKIDTVREYLDTQSLMAQFS
jgi:hypothetical protein